ncbi:MAG: ABC transporter ATP-binding protein [Alphaproteobacteria bacterium]|nr:MAG: ABC transporter ATP-binding protein [Alphaproteobacteria bacterium]TAF13406.1 MAG: ABC transporter ATP-binding protein [Alphaproteobacteria bacterium]TAF41871.1 MAG: ABC transporter ATP-binding protein [Alphaproteobacteria bacterium]TAF77222.1 MAG: ABC transporter ATP-binding protein [Alphaproteobacteria bacterium]
MQHAAIIHQLVKDFPVGDESIRVLHAIDAEIRMGELTMLVGPSGCGKTTLISAISGILSVTSGEIDILGRRLSSMSDKQKVLFRRELIGFIFQQYNLLPALTAAENAAMPLIAAGLSHSEAVRRAAEILEHIGMNGQTEKLPRQLSGGQQQRVAIARALVHNPKLIVCDEPTAALDAKTGHAVMEILRTIANDTHRAVLIVTHDNRIYPFADRILEMSDGRIIGDYTAEAFMVKEKL